MSTELLDSLRSESASSGSREDRARRIADRIRQATGRRWVGIYAVTSEEVVNLAWSGPAAPAYPTFPATQGLTSAAISQQATVVSNDVASDPRYLVAISIS